MMKPADLWKRYDLSGSARLTRMMREYHVRFCEGLGVKFPRTTRQSQSYGGAFRKART